MEDMVQNFSLLVGLFLTIGAPILKLIASITKLTSTVDNLQKDFDTVTSKNTDSHRRLWEKNDEQDEVLQDHEGRLIKLEARKNGYTEK